MATVRHKIKEVELTDETIDEKAVSKRDVTTPMKTSKENNNNI